MEHDKGRDFRRKKYSSYRQEREEKPMKRPIILMKSKENEKASSSKPEEHAPQTILLKTRDGENRAVSPLTTVGTKSSKEGDSTPTYQIAPRTTPADFGNILAPPPVMTESVKLLDDANLQIMDGILEYLTDFNDFLVVGCLGFQGVGKSTLLSHLVNPPSSDATSTPLVFKPQTKAQIDTAVHCTQGIDVYVTPERVIFLDTQPILSLSVMAKYYASENSGGLAARSCSRDDPDYPCVENDMELLSLQYAAFLMSVCHVLLVVQEYTFEPDIARFLQTAEMLKPSTGMHSDDEALIEYYPHTVLVHTKAGQTDFTSLRVEKIQENYKQVFAQSQLVIHSGIGIANGSVLKSLTPELCDCEPINLFLLPPFRLKGEVSYYELATYSELIKALRYQIYGLAPQALTNTVLSEKNWFYYASKIWDAIKKSTLFPEYGRLLPTATSVSSLDVSS